MSDSVDAVVVGAGPNGLAAALVLAGAGLEVEVHERASTIGGGARTAECTLPGYRHDVCSAVHPMGLASPFFRAFDLAAHGVEMLVPEVQYAQPLDGGRAGLAYRDVERTAEGLGRDGPAWRSLLGPLAEHWRGLVDAVLGDYRSVPRDLPTFVRFGLGVLEQGSPAWNARFAGDVAPALLTGVGTHAIAPPRGLGPAGAALMLGAAGHALGWPIPRGGSQSIVDAMAAELVRRGGRVVTHSEVTTLEELPRARAVLCDVAPPGLVRIAGEHLPAWYTRWLGTFRYGGATCKVDYALSGPVPWEAPGVDLAGTLHLGGTREEMVAAEAQVAAGRHSDRPFVIASQPGVVDPSRAPEGHHTLWAYGHVPPGSTRDIGEEVTDQVERFAPGFRDLVLHRTVTTAAETERHNPNYVHGDIAAGAMTPWQVAMRPLPTWDPYATPVPGLYLCSSSTPPGPAVHGMCGVHAARRALRQRFGIDRDPLELVAG
ncbi:phytoene desaturase family protein [Thalassiella azotivora]